MKLSKRSHSEFIGQIDLLRDLYNDDSLLNELGNFSAFHSFVKPQFPELCGDGIVRTHNIPRSDINSAAEYWWHITLLKSFLENSVVKPVDDPDRDLSGEWYISQIEQLTQSEILGLIDAGGLSVTKGFFSEKESLYSKDMVTYLVYWFLEYGYGRNETKESDTFTDYKTYEGDDDYEPLY